MVLNNERFSKGLSELGLAVDCKIHTVKGEQNRLTKSGKQVEIEYRADSDFYRLVSKLPNIKQDKTEILENKLLDRLGIMVDCSRNAVLNLQTIKKLIRKLAVLGYDYIMLYTEDTFEVDGEPYFGHMRGRYSKQELKDIVAYAEIFGIEIIPCIQTLAHLNQIFRWPVYQEINDVTDIVLIGEERTRILFENIFKTLAETFTSRNINIGMDEAHLLGLGKYLEKNGYEDKFSLMNKQLNLIIDICNKYGFKPYMWSDMFFRNAFQGNYYVDDKEIDEEILAKIPSEVGLIYWDYYSQDKKKYDGMIKSHKKFKNNELMFAGGAWKWIGFAPDNTFSLYTSKMAVDSCFENGIKNIVVTCWGDNGAECSIFSIMPSLIYFAERKFDNEIGFDDAVVNHTGISLKDFLLLDKINRFEKSMKVGELSNQCKALLYNDIFVGTCDSAVYYGINEGFENAYKELSAVNAGEYQYIFNTLAALADVLSVKAELSIRTRQAYKSKDFDTLKAIVKDIEIVIEKIKVFYKVFRKQWYIENKTFGFEVQDIRIGGLCQRLENIKQTLKDYLDSKIETIEELEIESEINPSDKNIPITSYVNNIWENIVSPSSI